ncbi:hypothetical protein GCM10027190_07350 [Spirosoma areae]
MAQGTVIDNGSPTNKWILHNPEDSRKTLFLTPWNNGTWDWGLGTQFKSTGDVILPAKVSIGSYFSGSPSSTLEVLGDFRTTTGRFSTIYSQNTDGLYPTTYANTIGDAQLSIGANWTAGYTDLSLINSNIANTSGGGFSFWQMMGANSKKMLAYLRGDGSVGFGGIIPTRALEVRGVNPIFRIGNSTAQNTQVNTVIGGIEFPTSGENVWMAKINANVGPFSDQPFLTFHTGAASAEQVRITQDGNVGIGTANPATKLEVRGGATSVDYLNVYPQNTTDEGGEISLQGSAGNQNWQMDVYGNTFRVHTNGIVPLQLYSDGSIITAGNGSFRDIVSTGTNSWVFHTPDDGRSDLFLAPGAPAPAYWDWAKQTKFKNNGDITVSGNIGIGTDTPGAYRLAVEGKIGAREVEVKTGSWADFVFRPNYRLRPLTEVSDYIKIHQHLPEIPSEADVKANGVGLGEMNVKLLQKIEELTLYMIEQQKRIERLEKQVLLKR